MNTFWKRKLPAFLLALVLAAGLMPSAMAVEHTSDHRLSEWKYNNTEHWKECLEAGCSEQVGKERHVLQRIDRLCVAATCYPKGKEVYACFCGFGKEDAVDATGAHVYTRVWTSDTSGHWYACTTPGCTNKSNYQKHSYDAGVYTTNSSQHWQTCKICGANSAKTSHVDNNKDGRCDVCTYGMGTIPAVKTYTVTFKNGSGIFSSQSVSSGGKPSSPGTPSYPGSTADYSYAFKGWTTSDPGTKAIYTGQTLVSPTSAAVTANIT